jgi:glycosyltransferase involved in cell wall biosynthesis
LKIEKVTISVIILTKNSMRTIDECLKSVLQQTLPPQEVIIVDGNSKDGTIEVLKRYPVKLLIEPGLGYGYARNIGLKNALGDVVAFVDSDCVLEKNYLEELIPQLSKNNGQIGGVGGITHPLIKNLISESLNVRLFGVSADSDNTIREIDSIGGGTSAYPKELLLKIGGFDTNISGGEDYELNLRLRKSGYKLMLIPSAISFHQHPTTLKKLAIKWYNYGKFLVDMAFKTHQSQFLLSTWAWIAGSFAILAIALFTKILFFWAMLLVTFFLPWGLYYGKQTVIFLVHNRKFKYLALPFIHQTIIISRSLGVVTATLRHLFKLT